MLNNSSMTDNRWCATKLEVLKCICQQYGPYLLILRGKLVEEGMLNEDICLGTKATTQRSDTWETKTKPVNYFKRISPHSCRSKLEFSLKTGFLTETNNLTNKLFVSLIEKDCILLLQRDDFTVANPDALCLYFSLLTEVNYSKLLTTRRRLVYTAADWWPMKLYYRLNEY